MAIKEGPVPADSANISFAVDWIDNVLANWITIALRITKDVGAEYRRSPWPSCITNSSLHNVKDVLVCMSSPSESLDKTGVEAAYSYHLDEAARLIVSCGDLRFAHAPEYGWHQRPNKLA